MARPGLLLHRKFIRLKRLIKSAAVALGSLELIWACCYENGDDYLGDSRDVEGMAEWDGDEGALTAALLDAGFIDELDDRQGHYICHDLWHHAPEYVQKRRKREAARQTKTDPCKEKKKNVGQCPDSDRRTADSGGQVADNDRESADSGDQSAAVVRHTRARSAPTPSTQHPIANTNVFATTADADVKKTQQGVDEFFQQTQVTPKLESAKPESKKEPRSRGKPKEPDVDETLGGKDSLLFRQFWRTMGVWHRAKVRAPRRIAPLWLEAVNKHGPEKIYLAALAYRDGHVPPNRPKDETQYMTEPLGWLQNEGYMTEIINTDRSELLEFANGS